MEPDAGPSLKAEGSARFTDVPIVLFVRGVSLLLVAVGVLAAAHWYVGARLIVGLEVPAARVGQAWVAVWAAFGSLFLAFIGGRVLPRRVARVFQWLGFGWMGAFGLLLVAFGVTDVAALLVGEVGEAALQARAQGIVAVVVVALAWGAFAARRPKVRRVEVPLPGLPEALDGFTLLQLTDVHIGETLSRGFAETLTRRANALEADAIVITGDLADGTPKRLRGEVAPLAGLRARHGVFYVTGNHEYYHGGPAWEAEGARLGFTVLHNEHRVLGEGAGRLVLAGVTDVEGANFARDHAPDVDAAFRDAPTGVTRILLAHQPRFAARAAGHDVALMLSGHTHGGQIFPFMFFVKLQQPVIRGLRRLSGVLTYTSNGTGYWGPPFRVGARGELTLVVLRRG